MSTVEIEYCVACGYLNRALATQRALLEEFGETLEAVALVPGDRGVFEVRVGGDTVWAGDVHGIDPDHDLICDTVRERVSTA